jgi:hypothetical protein
VLAAGTVAHAVLVITTVGVLYDLVVFTQTGHAFADHGLAAYGHLPGGLRFGEVTIAHYPYPPLLLPWFAAANAISDALGVAFPEVSKVLASFADVVIAWLVQDLLGRRGASTSARAFAAGLVALGPCFLATSAYHGQVDAAAILPAVAALWLWERGRHRATAWWSGALVGAGAAMKTFPGLLALPLIAAARSRREAVRVAIAAVAVPVLITLPFAVATPGAVAKALSYKGLPGQGGISLLAQPALADSWLHTRGLALNGIERALYGGGATALTTLGVVALVAFLAYTRPPAVTGAVLLWLTLYVCGVNFFLQYLVWGIPFFLMAGHLRAVAALQVAAVPALVLIYGVPWQNDAVGVVYAAILIGMWLAFAVALFAVARNCLRISPSRATRWRTRSAASAR